MVKVERKRKHRARRCSNDAEAPVFSAFGDTSKSRFSAHCSDVNAIKIYSTSNRTSSSRSVHPTTCNASVVLLYIPSTPLPLEASDPRILPTGPDIGRLPSRRSLDDGSYCPNRLGYSCRMKMSACAYIIPIEPTYSKFCLLTRYLSHWDVGIDFLVLRRKRFTRSDFSRLS